MLVPFRDYYRTAEEEIGAFYMWWDLADAAWFPDAAACLQILGEILAMPNVHCQKAALHGLNHMHPNPEAAAIVSRYLEAHRAELTADQIRYVECCRDGRSQ